MPVREWAWWQLSPLLRCYVAIVPGVALVVIAVAATHATWDAMDIVKYVLLLGCGITSVASTPGLAYENPGLTRDFSAVWLLPTAILLPPIYAALMPISLVLALHLWVHRGVVYRRVFAAAVISLSYTLTSVMFRLIPSTLAGSRIGSDSHALTWVAAVIVCGVIGGRVHHFLIMGAVKLTDPSVRILVVEMDRESLQGLFVEIDLGVLITVAVDLSPLLIVLVLPTVFLVRRFLVFPILVARSRVDSKTGLLNVSTWESEAKAELSRAVRLRNPLAVVIVDIDHFKGVNDTYGHLVGDRVLKAIAASLTSQSRDYDRVGRFGGEEFVLLLAQTAGGDACKIAERLRGYIASLAIPVDDHPGAPVLKATVSAGVTAMARGETYELSDLLAAADSAMYAAKQAGRNQVAFAPPLHDMSLVAWAADSTPGTTTKGANSDAAKTEGARLVTSPLTSHRVVLVQADPDAASSCSPR